MDINYVFPARSWFQGDSISFSLRLKGFVPSEWVVTYTFKRAGAPSFSFSSTPAIDGTFLMEVSATDTAHWTPGNYYLVATISDGTRRFTLGQIEAQVKPDLSIVTDPRSANRKAFDDVEAALAAGAGSDVVEYTIAGTTVKKDRPGLLALRAHYLARVRAEDGKPALGNVLYSL